MTIADIRRELQKDVPILLRKITYVIQDLEKHSSKEAQKQGFVRYYDYTSKFRNHWIYRVHINRKQSDGSNMLVYHNGKGHAGITVSPQFEIIYHSPHFFQRYNERRKLGLTDVFDIIRVYMNESQAVLFEDLEDIRPGVTKVFGQIPSGVVLGTLDTNIMLAKHLSLK